MLDFVIVIPARHDSTRFPGKPLIDLKGKSMIERTYNQCLKAAPKHKIYVATDDLKIYKHCEDKKINVKMTSKKCLTGTDRVAEFAESIKANYYINVQGDEPLFNPNDILKIIENLNYEKKDILNGYCKISNKDEFYSTSTPKVVFKTNGELMYMSRSPIPGNKKNEFSIGFRQVCIYAFTKESLVLFSNHKNKTPIEMIEDIEILRFIELGMKVKMIELSNKSIPVDNHEDIEKVLKHLKDE